MNKQTQREVEPGPPQSSKRGSLLQQTEARSKSSTIVPNIRIADDAGAMNQHVATK